MSLFMEKFYLAGLGNIHRSDTISDCKGYFKALRDEGLLVGDIQTWAENGWVPVGEAQYEIFCKIFGADAYLWEMSTNIARQEGRQSINVIRAEVKDVRGKFILANRLVHLTRNYSPLEFSVYPSDIEAKS
jgi:hypothetical protein